MLVHNGVVTTRPEFGISILPAWTDDSGQSVRLVQLADQLGYDLVGIQDHPYQWRFHDTWTLIAWLAGQTTRIRLFPDVANLPLRPPAMLAKSAASLDVLTGGRIGLGLGAGAFWDAVAAMGGARRTPAEALQATEEAIDVIRLVWSGQRGLRYDGTFYTLHGLNAGPPPAHPIGIWVGAYGRRMLELIGRKADGWVPSIRPDFPPERLAAGMRAIDQAAQAAGRDPRDIHRVLNVGAVIADAQTEPFTGPVPYLVERFTELALQGIDAFILWPAQDPERQIERFAAEVIPAVREAARTSGN
jgi:alkanesulfonate monooxygenase SsuD/methylene tetrahydromethanopterin reductase-like flavin-dependent oxidoreductase (luciferase family)